jgi:hypothetical protein
MYYQVGICEEDVKLCRNLCIIKLAFTKNMLSYVETFLVVVWWLVSSLWVSFIVTMAIAISETSIGRVHMSKGFKLSGFVICIQYIPRL